MTITADQLSALLGTKKAAPRCEACDYDMHRCQGCGTPLEHGISACSECSPGHCPECAVDEDPRPWCDCRDDETCVGPCRKRAHDPSRCPTLAPKPVQVVEMFRCRVCNEKLDPTLVRDGRHLLCEDPEPPSTIAELRDILIGYDSSRPRSMQVALGPSELGTPCQQQMARKLAGAPRRPVDAPVWAPFQGTAVHAEMEKVVAYWNAQLGRVRWLAEDDLQIDDEIAGHGDAYDLDHQMVVDWKHTGTTALTKLRTAKRQGKPARDQVSQDYRIQAHLYGLGHEIKGRPVQHVRLVLLARSWQYDDSEEWTEAYNPQLVDWALKRYYATKDMLAAVGQDNVAAVPAAPSSDACKFCPFLRPGQPSDWDGCAGDEANYQKTVDRFTDGLIIPTSGQ